MPDLLKVIRELSRDKIIKQADRIVILEEARDDINEILRCTEIEPPTQLPTLPGIIFRDEPTKEVVGPGVWAANPSKNPISATGYDDFYYLFAGDKIIAQCWTDGDWRVAGCTWGPLQKHAGNLQSSQANAKNYLAKHNLHGYHLATKHNITAEVADDVSYKNYALFHLCHITDGDDFFDTCIWTTQRRAKECYESYVASEIPCSLCGILPKSGVPVLLKSYNPNATEAKP